jgi:hypothetical protein
MNNSWMMINAVVFTCSYSISIIFGIRDLYAMMAILCSGRDYGITVILVSIGRIQDRSALIKSLVNVASV